MKKKRKENLPYSGLYRSGRPQGKTERKQKEYLYFARNFKKTMTVIKIVIGALGTVTKGLVKRLEDLEIRVETVKTTALERSTRILRVLET